MNMFWHLEAVRHYPRPVVQQVSVREPVTGKESLGDGWNVVHGSRDERVVGGRTRGRKHQKEKGMKRGKKQW
jgi:hypothetical protein